MTLGMLGVAYLAVGVALAIGLGIARRLTSTSDAILMIGLWPLWAPLQLAHHTDGVVESSHERELMRALARAKTSPIASVLPDADGARVLGTRLREASLRLGELETVLARPDFDPAAVEQRAVALEARGAMAAAGTARLRVRTLGQLRTLRERYRAELDEVHELIAQLVAQAELVRLGELGQDSSELVRELVARIEGLGDLFAYQTSIDEYGSARAE